MTTNQGCMQVHVQEGIGHSKQASSKTPQQLLHGAYLGKYPSQDTL
jgi:hypothetical protein